MIQMKIIVFIKVVEHHVPLIKRFARRNQVPFMNKELRKALYAKSSLRIIFVKALQHKMKKSTEYNETRVFLRKKNSKK